jgi:hypothetical protein
MTQELALRDDEVDDTDGYDLDSQDLVEYAVELLDGMEPGELAGVERTYEQAVTIARAFKDGLIDAYGITDLGHDHLADLYNDYENGE